MNSHSLIHLIGEIRNELDRGNYIIIKIRGLWNQSKFKKWFGSYIISATENIWIP